MRRGFNEAPACLPGKLPARVVDVEAPQRASMRPRRVCRGNEVAQVLRPSRVDASMRPRRVCRGNRARNDGPARGRGPRFNEAPACLPGKCHAARAVRRPVLHASMRPRRVCRGNAPVPGPGVDAVARFNEAPACLPGKCGVGGDARDPLPASMRPRRVCRGNASRSAWRSARRPPSFNEAPACLPGKWTERLDATGGVMVLQ